MELELSEKLPGGPWTNEKHFHFLNTIEASFVRTMLENNGVHGTHQLRLDRYLPDSSDSTLDSKSHTRNKHLTSSSGDIGVGPTRNRVEGGRIDRRSRRLFHVSSQDQVVPQLEDRNGDKDERDHHGNVAVTSMAPAS